MKMRRFIFLFLLLSLYSSLSYSLFIEGDILFREETDPESNLETAGGVKLADPSKKWPGGYVYYRFDRTFQNHQHQRHVENMMRYIETKVNGCVTFEKSELKVDFVSITADGGNKGSGTNCFSDLGRVGGKQILNLDTSCLRNHTIAHELMHTLGFNHEHNRPDRDSYVTVFTENILENKMGNFKKRESGNSKWFKPGDVNTLNTPFDFMSVLLYPPSISNSKSVSKNGKQTLKYNAPLIPSWPNFSHDEEPLSVIDTVELSLAYSCPIDQDTLIQYVHYNRLSSSQKISDMNRKLDQQIEETLSSKKQMKNFETKIEHLEKICNTLSTEIKGFLPMKQIPSDPGYANCNAGYFDAQGFGVKLDYCRWVGNGGCRKSPSYWSCALAGKTEQKTPKGMFNEPALPSKRPIPSDAGYSKCNAGYFDAQGFGMKLDYCRWVGNGGCRKSPSYWSCALAGKTEQKTRKGMFNEPALPTKRPIPSDLGHSKCNAGYFDAQGFGVKLDYCRWVGNGGCRRKPSYWSCALAGKTEQYTPEGMFDEPK